MVTIQVIQVGAGFCELFFRWLNFRELGSSKAFRHREDGEGHVLKIKPNRDGALTFGKIGAVVADSIMSSGRPPKAGGIGLAAAAAQRWGSGHLARGSRGYPNRQNPNDW